MKYSVVAKKDAKSHAVEEKIKERLQSSGWIYDKAEPQLVICVGGDGTLLYGVHQYLHRISEVNFLGIHTGTLGFFTDYTEEELEECLHDVLEKEPVIFESGLLKIKLDNNPNPYYALNEMRVENIVKSQIMDIYVAVSYTHLTLPTKA